MCIDLYVAFIHCPLKGGNRAKLRGDIFRFYSSKRPFTNGHLHFIILHFYYITSPRWCKFHSMPHAVIFMKRQIFFCGQCMSIHVSEYTQHKSWKYCRRSLNEWRLFVAVLLGCDREIRRDKEERGNLEFPWQKFRISANDVIASNQCAHCHVHPSLSLSHSPWHADYLRFLLSD